MSGSVSEDNLLRLETASGFALQPTVVAEFAESSEFAAPDSAYRTTLQQ